MTKLIVAAAAAVVLAGCAQSRLPVSADPSFPVVEKWWE
jgi:uncharacterized lipoprotein YajG